MSEIIFFNSIFYLNLISQYNICTIIIYKNAYTSTLKAIKYRFTNRFYTFKWFHNIIKATIDVHVIRLTLSVTINKFSPNHHKMDNLTVLVFHPL